jgi:hypothetical protein
VDASLLFFAFRCGTQHTLYKSEGLAVRRKRLIPRFAQARNV